MHTPGPWNTEHPYNEPGIYISGPHTQLIAKVYNEEDAALIAAAPALLAALEDAEFLLRKLAIHPNDSWAMRDSLTRSAQDAREALALAKGN